jgi:hypothetical protein
MPSRIFTPRGPGDLTGKRWQAMAIAEQARLKAEEEARAEQPAVTSPTWYPRTAADDYEPKLIFCACHSGCQGSTSSIGHHCGCPQ